MFPPFAWSCGSLTSIWIGLDLLLLLLLLLDWHSGSLDKIWFIFKSKGKVVDFVVVVVDGMTIIPLKFVVTGVALLALMQMILHFFALKLILFSHAHFARAFRSSWNMRWSSSLLISATSLASFANNKHWWAVNLDMSLIKSAKINGPSTDPWETQLRTSKHSDACSPIITFCLRPLKKLVLQPATNGWKLLQANKQTSKQANKQLFSKLPLVVHRF